MIGMVRSSVLKHRRDRSYRRHSIALTRMIIYPARALSMRGELGKPDGPGDGEQRPWRCGALSGRGSRD